MKAIRIFSPATVANLSCGFDVLGLALDTVGDEMLFTKNETKALRITKIEGADLPYEIENNVVGVVAKTMLNDLKVTTGLDIEIYKKFKPGSGIGSSAASAAGTAFAINKLFGEKYCNQQLIDFAMLGEQFVGGAKVADNVAPAILGGICLIKSYEPLQVISLPVLEDLHLVIAHPQVELKTSDSRKVVQQKVPLHLASKQAANLASFVHALHTNNYELLAESIQDVLVEPHRALLIPLFQEVKTLATSLGALGAGISGSGPSMFVICKGKTMAQKLENALQELYASQKIACHIFSSPINKTGIRIL